MMRWWLDRGVDGFRMDVINMISKDPALPDGPVLGDGAVRRRLGRRTSAGRASTSSSHEMHREVFAGRDGAHADGRRDARRDDRRRRGCSPTRPAARSTWCSSSSTSASTTAPASGTRARSTCATSRRRSGAGRPGSPTSGGTASTGATTTSRASCRASATTASTASRSATMLATVLHLHRGTPYVYQGEELGMTNVAVHVDRRLPRHRGAQPLRRGRRPRRRPGRPCSPAMAPMHRDNARTPMQWDDSPHAGFTTGTPWIAVNPNHATINAAAARADPDSVFHHYRRLIELRHTDRRRRRRRLHDAARRRPARLRVHPHARRRGAARARQLHRRRPAGRRDLEPTLGRRRGRDRQRRRRPTPSATGCARGRPSCCAATRWDDPLMDRTAAAARSTTSSPSSRGQARRRRALGRRAGRSASCTTAARSVHDVAERAAPMFLHENALNTAAFPSLGADPVRRRAAGRPTCCTARRRAAGFLTSGGTESIQCAVLAARERGRVERGVTAPEIVLAESAHAAFHKSAHLFGMRVVHDAGARRLDRRRRRDGRRRRAEHGARRRLGAAVPAGRRRPDPGDRRAGRHRRRQLPRRRLHGRLRAAVRRAARARRAAVGLPRRRRALDLGRRPQARLRPEGRVGDPPPHQGAAPLPDVRVRRLARRAVRLAEPAGHPLGRCRWRRRGR